MRLPILLVSVFGLVLAAEAEASPFVFSTIDFPDAAGTSLVGVNNAGVIVGNARTVQGSGFIYSGGSFSLLTAPKGVGVAGSLAAGGISNAGTVTGSFLSSTLSPYPGTNYGGKSVGFVQGASSFEILDLNFFDTIPHAINVAGRVVGEVSGPSPGSIGAFTYINSVRGYGPGGLTDQAFYPAIRDRGINDAGDIVGTYGSLNGSAGFLVANGITTKLTDPDGISTYAYGVNNQRQVVGFYVSGTRAGYGYVDIQVHGFIESAGLYDTIDIPGAVSTMAQAVNDRGEVVGTYVDANGVDHGFVATPVTDVPEPGSAVLLGAGLLAVLGFGRSRRRGRIRLFR